MIVILLFYLSVFFTQKAIAEESMAMYLGLSENEVEAVRKREYFSFDYSGKEYFKPSLIGDQSLWTKVEMEDIPVRNRSAIMKWINAIFNPKAISSEKEIEITGWRYYFGYTIEPGVKTPKEAYKAGISYLTVRFEKDGNKVLMYPTGTFLKIWVKLNERYFVENLTEEELEMFSKNFIKTFFSLPDDSVESLQYRKTESELSWLSCALQTTFDMTTRPKVRDTNQDYPRAFVWCEQFKIQTNGQIVYVSLPQLEINKVSPEGVINLQQTITHRSPAF